MYATTSQAPFPSNNKPCSQDVVFDLKKKTMRAIQILEKLFKNDVLAKPLQWTANKRAFIVLEVPCKVEEDSFEKEVIDYYFKNVTISENQISIPYRSLK